MLVFRSVSRTLAVSVASIALVACYPEQLDIGDAETGADLAPSLDALRAIAPEYHRRLADGTFDSLSLVEQWDFVVEVRGLPTKHSEARRAETRSRERQWTVEFLDSIEAMPPESAQESLALRREMLLRELKIQSDSLRMENWAVGFARSPSDEDAPR